jgi:hypothetical protein
MTHSQTPWVHDDTWIANGKFAIKKSRVKDADKYCFATEAAKRDIQALATHENMYKCWIKTNKLFSIEEDYYIRVFECMETGETVCFKEEYIKYFLITRLVSTDSFQIPFMTKERDFFLMPHRYKKTSFE